MPKISSKSKTATTATTAPADGRTRRPKKELPPALAEKLKNTQIVTRAASRIYATVAALNPAQKKEVWNLVTEEPGAQN